MKILISGATGLVGSAASRALTASGRQVQRLVRAQSTAGPGDVVWDPAGGSIDAAKLEGFDGVVHLAGENIAAGRWTEKQKARIRDSRIKGTRALCDALAGLGQRPRVLVAASAVGYYGDRGDEWLDEESAAGSGFLADVCREWEAATGPARSAGVRVVNLRFGVILSGTGGALAKMLLPFKLGLGGRIGSGRQYMSWIAIDDVVRAIQFILDDDALAGPVNAVSPRPASNLEFTKTLGRVLGRPTIFPMPAAAARLAFGQMADELLLASARVRPARLTNSSFAFQYPGLKEALSHVLGKDEAGEKSANV